MDTPVSSFINETYNSTDFELEYFERESYTDVEKQQLRMYCIFAMIVGSLIIITNLIVVVSSGLIIKTGQEPKSAYMQLGNASLAHMFIGASVMFGVGLPKRYISHNLCVLQIGMIVSGTVTSIYSVGLVAVDRFIYILYNNHHKKWATTRRVRISIVLAWILGIVLGYMPITGWAGDTLEGRKCWYIKLSPPELLILTSAVGFIPVVVVCVLYSIILYHALKKVQQLKHASRTDLQDFTEEDNTKLRVFRGRNSNTSIESSNQSVNTLATSSPSDMNKTQIPNTAPNRIANQSDVKKLNNKEPTKWKAIKVVLFTTGSFVCTWVPYFIASLIYVKCMHDKDQKRCSTVEVALASPLAMLGLLNSLLNPVIYAWWHRGFRASLKKIFLKQMKILKINASDPRHKSSITNSSSGQMSRVTNIP